MENYVKVKMIGKKRDFICGSPGVRGSEAAIENDK